MNDTRILYNVNLNSKRIPNHIKKWSCYQVFETFINKKNVLWLVKAENVHEK